MEENTDQQILAAAKKLFLEKGFAMTSTADIAREAGCNSALIHYYFRTKDNLFKAVFEKEMAGFSKGLAMIPAENIPFTEKIRMMAEMHFEFMRSNPRIPFLLTNEFTTNPKRVDDFKDLIIEKSGTVLPLLQKEIDKEAENGTIRWMSAIDMALNLISLNAMTFIMLPIIERLNFGVDINEVLNLRKREIVNTILGSFKINDDEK